jgi:hypothetical protein
MELVNKARRYYELTLRFQRGDIDRAAHRTAVDDLVSGPLEQELLEKIIAAQGWQFFS